MDTYLWVDQKWEDLISELTYLTRLIYDKKKGDLVLMCN